MAFSLGRLRHRARWYDHITAWLLGAIYVLLLLGSADMGFTRDESFYFRAGKEYVVWFTELETHLEEDRVAESFTQEHIDPVWEYNPEHPVLLKSLFGISYEWLHVRHELLSPSEAMRFPAMVFAGLLLVILHLFTLEVFGSRVAALGAVGMMAMIPRFFFHAHLTCFDVPMVTMWVAVIYAYWKSLDRSAWAWVAGVLWGLALTTKLNAFFIPVVLLTHWGLGGARNVRFKKGKLSVPTVPLALFTMLFIGFAIFYIGWPRHWFDTFDRVRWYIAFHLEHEHYFVYYFGQHLFKPPFPVAFPFVMTLVTTPVVILFAWGTGLGRIAYEFGRDIMTRGIQAGDRHATGILIALNIAIPFLIIARPSTPIFGGVKHWFTALPFLCMLGGYGLSWIARAVAEEDKRFAPLIGGLLLAAVLVPSWRATMSVHPYGTSYHNALVGGVTGSQDARNMRQFWGYASRGALDWLNENADQNARVFWHNTTGYAVQMYEEEGWIRDDLRSAWSPSSADYLIYHHQKSFHFMQAVAWLEFETYSPLHTVTVNGVPVASIYGRAESVMPDASEAGALTPSAVSTAGGEAEADERLEGSGTAAGLSPLQDAEGSGEAALELSEGSGSATLLEDESPNNPDSTPPPTPRGSATGVLTQDVEMEESAIVDPESDESESQDPPSPLDIEPDDPQ